MCHSSHIVNLSGTSRAYLLNISSKFAGMNLKNIVLARVLDITKYQMRKVDMFLTFPLCHSYLNHFHVLLYVYFVCRLVIEVKVAMSVEEIQKIEYK